MVNKLVGLVLAGGKGSRLGNIAEGIPKPLIQVGNKKIIDYIIDSFKSAGIEDIYLTTKYRKELLQEYAESKGVQTMQLVTELQEAQAGNIWSGLEFNSDVLMSVGDTITNIDLKDLIKFHYKNKADFTVTSKILDYKIPFGTMKKKGNRLVEWLEKPNFRVEVALGIFIINKDLWGLVPEGKFDIPDFINLCMKKNKKVLVYPYYDDYIKIDTPKEYEDAQIKIKLLHKD